LGSPPLPAIEKPAGMAGFFFPPIKFRIPDREDKTANFLWGDWRLSGFESWITLRYHAGKACQISHI
jgi:hypothetical protein